MGIEQQGYNDGIHNSGMKNDPNWSDAEKDKYNAAYHAAKKKGEEKKD